MTPVRLTEQDFTISSRLQNREAIMDLATEYKLSQSKIIDIWFNVQRYNKGLPPLQETHEYPDLEEDEVEEFINGRA